jgi:lipid-A-disaccharide synthase
MKYFLLAGEASGDLHGSKVVESLLKNDKDAIIHAWGGDLMEKAGATIQKHFRDLAFMGFAEVIANIRTIFKNFDLAKKHILDFNPDVIVFIDYPGFNLRMAKWSKSKGFKNLYYISPQVWAWKSSRVFTIKKTIDKMLVILPFEKEWFKKYHYNVEYVGHPLMDFIPSYIPKEKIETIKLILAILPGSRKQEIKTMLPIMIEAARRLPHFHCVIAMAPSIEESFYRKLLPENGINYTLIKSKTYDLLAQANLAMVTSGTATLETALFKVPQVVCYKGNSISYSIAKRLIKIKYISLVNLILDKPLVKELIQNDFNHENLFKELTRLESGIERYKIIEGYNILAKILHTGPVADKVAQEIIELSKNQINL